MKPNRLHSLTKVFCTLGNLLLGALLPAGQKMDLLVQSASSPAGPWTNVLRFAVPQGAAGFFRVAMVAAVLTNAASGAVIYIENGGNLGEAKANATWGTTIVVGPGTYSANNLLKPGVDWYFQDGAVVTFHEPNVGPGWGIFDDRSSGPTTNYIGGHGRFNYIVGVPGYTNTGTFSVDPTNFAVVGALVMTNPTSRVTFIADRLEAGYGGTFANFSVIYAKDGTLNVDCPEILDSYADTPLSYGADESGVDQGTGVGRSTCVFWSLGELHVNSMLIHAGYQYAVWCEQTVVAGRATNNAWINAHRIVNHGGLSAVYMVGFTNAYRTWVNALEIRRDSPNGGAGYSGYAAYSGGKHYVFAEKISNNGGDAAIVVANSNCTAWVTAQKVSGSTNSSWIKILANGGTLYANIDHFEDEGLLTRGIWVAGGELHLRGGYAKSVATDGIVLSNCNAWIDGLWFDNSSGSSATNRGVTVLGTSTVRLKNVDLLAPVGAWNIFSPAAGNLKVLGTGGVRVNKAGPNSGGLTNLTTQIGTVTYDTNLQ